jgi:hypothetical protein
MALLSTNNHLLPIFSAFFKVVTGFALEIWCSCMRQVVRTFNARQCRRVVI